MMIPILIESRKPGSSPWIGIHRAARAIRASGLEGDRLELRFRRGSPESVDENCMVVTVDRDCELELPEGARSIRAQHIEASGSGVTLDIMMKE